MAEQVKVERPTKKSEYTIVFASTSAQRGWTNLLATTRGPLVDAWDLLTHTPLERTPTNYSLQGELRTITRDGTEHQRWQHKPTRQGDARIWFYVQGQVVHLEEVHTPPKPNKIVDPIDLARILRHHGQCSTGRLVIHLSK